VGSRRTLILVVSLLFAVLAGLLAFQYVGGIEDKAIGQAQTTDVVIVKAAVKKGNEASPLIDSGVLGLGTRRQVDLPANAVKRVEDLKGLVSALDLEPGTIVTSSMFLSANSLDEGVSNVLAEGRVAVTFQFDQIRSVAGLVKQGDYVNIEVKSSCVLAEGGAVKSGAATSPEEGSTAPAAQTAPCTGLLYQKVKILALGKSLGTPVAATNPDGTPAAAPAETSSDTITFEVPQDAAQLMIAAGGDKMYLTLVRPDYVPAPLPVTLDPLPFPGADGVTPYDAAPGAPAPEAAPKAGA